MKKKKSKKRNVEMGKWDSKGRFHPIRYSKDYDPDKLRKNRKKKNKMSPAVKAEHERSKRRQYLADIARHKKLKKEALKSYRAGRARAGQATANRRKKRNIPLLLANKSNFQKMYDDVTYIEATKGKDFGVTKGKYYHQKEHKAPMKAYRIKSGKFKNDVILTHRKLN